MLRGSALCLEFWGSHGDIDSQVGIDGDMCWLSVFAPAVLLVRISLCGALYANPMALELGTRIDSVLQ